MRSLYRSSEEPEEGRRASALRSLSLNSSSKMPHMTLTWYFTSLIDAPRVSGIRWSTKQRQATRTTPKGTKLQGPRACCMKGKPTPTRKLQNQLIWQARLWALATYLGSNISGTMSHGMGPNPNSKKQTKVMTAARATKLGRTCRRAATTKAVLTIIPPALTAMRVRLPTWSIRKVAASVAITLMAPTRVDPRRGLSITPRKKSVE
mmetsp:Transcript_65810/g.148479  ORF Transcript_65810/g.148479 Transcript_65810/m.148479 type:complete len:206 (+) Transcript_65810:475-1092(+)